MPFVITTKRRGEPTPLFRGGKLIVVSRRAVATLEEASRAIYESQRAADPEAGRATGLNTFTVTAAGGTVGPLPDGTVIEVESRAWYKLAIDVHMLPAWQQGADTPHVGAVKAEIIAAYNAAQEVPHG